MLEIKIRGIPFPARRPPEVRPAADLAGGALEELRIDERLHHHDGMIPEFQPVGGQASQHEFHETADPVGKVTVRQDQQAGVVGEERAAAAALLGRPADERIAGLDVKGAGAPGGDGQPFAAIGDGVAEMFADERGVVQVVMLDDQFVAAGEVRSRT